MKQTFSIWVTGGAVFAAILSSVCCWLPLLLLSFGASAVSLSGFFETYRSYFLCATMLFLAVAFYLVYVRPPRCLPGESCTIPNTKFQKLNKVLLWLAVVFVLVFSLFPNYFGTLLGYTKTALETEINRTELNKFVFYVDGMPCDACVIQIEASLTKIPGVISAEVSYEKKIAVVYANTKVKEGDLHSAVKATGYKFRMNK